LSSAGPLNELAGTHICVKISRSDQKEAKELSGQKENGCSSKQGQKGKGGKENPIDTF
jgi:hypothetical protein